MELKRPIREVFKKVLYPVSVGVARFLRQTQHYGLVGEVLLIPPVSKSGSLGDLALLLGARSAIDGRVGLLSVRNKPWDGSTEQLDVKHHFFSGSAFSICGDIEYAQIVARYKRVMLFGADVLDGAYSPKHSKDLIDLVMKAYRFGAKVRIAGFSFNSTPDRRVVRKLRELPEAIELCSRDPISHRRLESLLERTIIPCADVAFLLKERTTLSGEAKRALEWVAEQKLSGKLVIGINASPLLSQFDPNLTTSGIIDMIVRLIEVLHKSRECAFLLIPHDFRAKNDDREMLRSISKGIASFVGNGYMLLAATSDPAAIKRLCGELDFVIGTRMHLIIEALGAGTPVAAVDYQEKFGGLFELFGIDEALFSIQEAFHEDRMLDRIPLFVDERDRLSRCVKDNLRKVKTMAEENFVWTD